MNDRIGLADVGQELGYPDLHRGGAPATSPAMSWKAICRVGDDLRCPHGLRYGVEPWVGHRDHRDVGLDRRSS